MGGKFVVRARQHLFESGEKVVAPITVLPTAPNDYSHKVNYKFKYTDSDGEKSESIETNKKVFVVDDDTGQLLVQRKLLESNQDTSLRFYTSVEKPFTAMLFYDDVISMDSPIDTFIDEDEDEDEDEENHNISDED